MVVMSSTVPCTEYAMSDKPDISLELMVLVVDIRVWSDPSCNSVDSTPGRSVVLSPSASVVTEDVRPNGEKESEDRESTYLIPSPLIEFPVDRWSECCVVSNSCWLPVN